jgi:hypothetical protein
MHKRHWFVSVAFFAAVLALAVASLTPVALAAASPTPVPSGTPVVKGTIPNPLDPKGIQKWTGDIVQINFTPNGSELAVEKSKIFINGAEQKLSKPPFIVPAVSRATSTLQFDLAQKYGAGDYEFKTTLETKTGTKVTYTWKFGSTGDAQAGSLVSVQVMKDWFWYIARGGLVTVELTVISIVFACLLALFGSLGRLSKKMTFKQAWARYQSWGYMWRMVIGRIPYWAATFYTSLFRGTPLLLQIIAI